MNPTDRIPVILEVQTWEMICRVLADAPYRISAPLISEIQTQCMKQQQQQAPEGQQPLALVPREQEAGE